MDKTDSSTQAARTECRNLERSAAVQARRGTKFWRSPNLERIVTSCVVLSVVLHVAAVLALVVAPAQ